MNRTKPDIYAPSGYTFYARRLNRHSYHLFKNRGAKSPLCGATDEIGLNGSTMEYLLDHDSHKRCEECLALAGAFSGVEEVKAAKVAHARAEEAHAARMREALTALRYPGEVESLSHGQLIDELRRIESEAGAAWRRLPF
jgi:hypothetical protein